MTKTEYGRILGIEWGGILRERWDDTTRTVATYDATGTPTGTRPYTAAENAAADAAAAAKAAEQARKADRASIIGTALVWLAADSQQAATRAKQIAAAITSLDAQIAAVNAYTFAGANVTAINASLNSALKPQLVATLQRQRAIGVMLQELMVARDKHGDALVWLGRYLTS